jgi:hypothetical protein
VAAAGITPRRAGSHGQWPPAKILSSIRSLGRRQQPLAATELRDRHSNLVAAARRVFGSWSKAVVAAGVDPAKLRRVVPWTRDRILEEILTRAIKDEPLRARTVQPRSLADAGARLFGTWAAALAAAGIDSGRHVPRPLPERRTLAEPDSHLGAVGETPQPPCSEGAPQSTGRRAGQTWTKDGVIAEMLRRLSNRLPINAASVYRDDRPLFRAGTRRFGNWDKAMAAAGLDPAEHRRYQRRLLN